MLRTIIETKDELGRWNPSLPLWFGEPSDPWFFFDSEEVLAKALIELGATVVTETFPRSLYPFYSNIWVIILRHALFAE